MPRPMGKLVQQRGVIALGVREALEGRQPHIVPPTPPIGQDATTAAMTAFAGVLERIVDKLNAPAQPPPAVPVGVGAPPPAPPPAAVTAPAAPGGTSFERMVSKMTETFMASALKKVEATFQAAISGTSETAQPSDAVAEVVDPDEDKPGDPFRASPVGDQTWPDGSKVYAPRTETGDVDWSVKSIIATNPFLAMKAMDIAGKTVSNVGDALADVMRKAAAAGQAHVVSSIPSGAQQAGVGVGAPSEAPAPPSSGGSWPGTPEV